MNALNRCVPAVALVAALAMPGCITGHRQIEEVGVAKAFDATQAAMKDLEFTIKETAKDALQARVVAVEADKTEVNVDMEAKGEKLTEFRIRIGLFGDEAQARLIMEKIRKHF